MTDFQIFMLIWLIPFIITWLFVRHDVKNDKYGMEVGDFIAIFLFSILPLVNVLCMVGVVCAVTNYSFDTHKKICIYDKPKKKWKNPFARSPWPFDEDE